MTFNCDIPPSGATARFALHCAGQLPTLTTQRVILRAPRVTDFDAYAEIACSLRGASLGGPLSREDAWRDFAQMISGWPAQGHGLWTVGHAGTIAGFVVLGFEPGDTAPELAVLLTESAEGRGLAFDAAQAAKQHAFETIGCDTIVSSIGSKNLRAQALAARLGGRQNTALGGLQIWRYRREAQA
jgi:RimJ/RimL family protein N-acetyltransferase